MKTLAITTHHQVEMIDITSRIREAIAESGISSGLALLHVPHTTAGITINENADPDVVRDLLAELNKIVPFQDNYRHGEGNSAAHIKSTLVGPQQWVIIEGGKPVLGTWQALFFCEFDGPRQRKLHIQVVGS
ncbi:MAG: secondary thiamine-phosphate synthase enzyme YjbQ [Syntrophotaleaceae bacterium]